MTDKQRVWFIIAAVVLVMAGTYLLAYMNTLASAWWLLPTQIFTILGTVTAGIMACVLAIGDW